MKLVKAKPWYEGECEGGHKEPMPSIVEVGVKGISFQLCAACTAQLIKELAPPLGEWAMQAIRHEIGSPSGDPESKWPPDTTD